VLIPKYVASTRAWQPGNRRPAEFLWTMPALGVPVEAPRSVSVLVTQKTVRLEPNPLALD
jgi:hypothetical protein